MSLTRTTPASALELLKKLTLEDLKPTEAFQRFKAIHTIPIMELIDGVLNNDLEKISLFEVRRLFSTRDKKMIADWAKNYFSDIFKMTTQEILDTKEFPNKTANELCLLGHIYGYGIGTDKNDVIAFHFLQRSAHKESAWGLRNVAYCMQHGLGTQQNIPEARAYLLRSLTTSEIARNALAFLIKTHFPSEQEEALCNYILAAIHMNDCALSNLAICFKTNYYGLKADPYMAAKCVAAAISRGNRQNALLNINVLPDDEQWQYTRLIATGPANAKIRAALATDIAHHSPALTYHAAFALQETKDADESAKLKKAFAELCDAKPDTVKKLMQELDDSEDDVLEVLLDEQQKNWLSYLCFFQMKTNFLTKDPFVIVVRYLDFPLFACRHIFNKEVLAKDIMESLLSKNTLFAKKQAARVERGEISYQMAVKGVF